MKNMAVGGILLIIVVAAIFIGSAKLTRQFQSAKPGCHSYRWGYAFGLLFLHAALVPWGGLIWFLAVGWGVDAGTAMVGLLLGGCSVMLGLGILLRDRQAFILGTVVTLNPVLWFFNAVYLFRRWEELGGTMPQTSPISLGQAWRFFLARTAEVSRAVQGRG